MSQPDQPESQNPITELSPNSLTELFSRDPNDWNDQDLEKIVSALRADRARHQKAEAEGKVKGQKRPGKAPAPTSLADLGLEIK